MPTYPSLAADPRPLPPRLAGADTVVTGAEAWRLIFDTKLRLPFGLNEDDVKTAYLHQANTRVVRASRAAEAERVRQFQRIVQQAVLASLPWSTIATTLGWTEPGVLETNDTNSIVPLVTALMQHRIENCKQDHFYFQTKWKHAECLKEMHVAAVFLGYLRLALPEKDIWAIVKHMRRV